MSQGLRDIRNFGHRFGPELVCSGQGCNQTWQGQQDNPTTCQGEYPSLRNMRKIASLCHHHHISYVAIGQRAGISDERVRQVLSVRSDSTSEMFVAVVRACEELLQERGVVVSQELTT